MKKVWAFSLMRKRFRLVIMISGRGSNMTALIRACREDDYLATVVKVISDRADAPGVKRARAEGIDAVALERSLFASRQEHEAAMLDELKKEKPDLICLAGFMRILSGGFVREYEGKIVNVHPSLLPRHPGLNTHARALAAGDSEHGCTIHYVSEGIDEGPIIAQARVFIEPDDNENSLARKVLNIEHKLYVDAVCEILSKRDLT